MAIFNSYVSHNQMVWVLGDPNPPFFLLEPRIQALAIVDPDHAWQIPGLVNVLTVFAIEHMAPSIHWNSGLNSGFTHENSMVIFYSFVPIEDGDFP